MPETYSSMAETGTFKARKFMFISPEIRTTEAVVALNYDRNVLFYNYWLGYGEWNRLRHGDSDRLRDMYRDWVRNRNFHRDADWIRHWFLNGEWHRLLYRNWVWLRNVHWVGSVYRYGHRYLDRDRHMFLNSDWIRLWNWNFDFLGYCDGLHFTMAHRAPSKSVATKIEAPIATYVKTT
jgi:hypothetical protein